VYAAKVHKKRDNNLPFWPRLTDKNIMSASQEPLPDFANPPVVEVALSVQFQPLPLRTAYLGRFWASLSRDFTRTEDQPIIEAVHEPFDPRQYVRDAGIRVRTLDVPPVPRVWFLNDTGTELIQLQQDRFIHNWRKADDNAEYIRYPRVRERFADSFEKFESFVRSEKLGHISPDQCEVTYTNHLVEGYGWDRQGQLDQVFTFWQPQVRTSFLPEPENASISVRFVIPGPGGDPIGRLHVEAQPAFRKTDLRPILVVNLTARGAPLGTGLSGVMDFFDIGREWIVRGFAAITTNEMHAIWRRTDASW
jgi:uncharacterized protein (TIGR04255 family)